MKKKSRKASAADEFAISETPASFYRTATLGKYAKQYAASKGDAIVLEPDLRKEFRTSKEVNEALRVMQQLKRMVNRSRKAG